MDDFKRHRLTTVPAYATPPGPGERKDRKLNRQTRRKLARATVELAREAQKDWPPAPERPEKP